MKNYFSELSNKEIILVTKQIEVLMRENASLIYLVLNYFGKLRPKNIQKYSNISMGRMFNELTLLQQAELVKKENFLEGKTKKPFYAALSQILDGIKTPDLDIGNFQSLSKDQQIFFNLYLKFTTKFPALFQNFVSKVSSAAITAKVERNSPGQGDLKSYHNILQIPEKEYEILRSKVDALIYDLSKVELTNDGRKVAMSISLFYMEVDD